VKRSKRTTAGGTAFGSEPTQAVVDEFVTAKASDFNKVQHGSTSAPQTVQQQSLGINKNP
jgi:hypothetical protein